MPHNSHCKSMADSHGTQVLAALKDAPAEIKKRVSEAFRFIKETAETHPNLSCPYCSDPVAVAANAASAAVAAVADRVK